MRHGGRSLPQTVTHCNTLQHTAAHRSTLQHTTTHRNTLQHDVCTVLYNYILGQAASASRTMEFAADCNTLQHTATHCNTLQHTATHCNTLQHTAYMLIHTYIRREKNGYRFPESECLWKTMRALTKRIFFA